jgi:phosphate acyltransferase
MDIEDDTKPRTHVILDAMGSDNHPQPEVDAAVEAIRSLKIEITLVGPEMVLRSLLDTSGGETDSIHIVHAPEILRMADKPAENTRRKQNNSMAVGLGLLKSGMGDAFVTAGNTGGAMANALFQLGRIRGVKRPGLSGIFPSKNGRVIVLDIGANTDCKAIYLLQFAIMGAVYGEQVLGFKLPRVGLLSNGEEPGKGSLLIQEAYPLLENSGLNFIGNVEPKELFGGDVDVVVTDGFTGNILLKSSEAATKLLVDTLRAELTASPRNQAGALLARPALMKIKKILDPGEIGAAPLLGVNGLVLIGHGRSDTRAMVSAIRTASQAAEANLLGKLQTALVDKLAVVAPD